MITRWNAWYSRENLASDERILAAPPSICARNAAAAFLSKGKRRVLDVACGVGRDTFFLEEQGLSLTGVDASFNGLLAASQVKSARGAATDFLTADARHLPFASSSFDGLYCFGLLHEFVGPGSQESVARVVAEFRRLLRRDGILVVTAVSGSPEAGLPQVQCFTLQMFEDALAGWKPLEISAYDDVGCTSRTDYHIWYGLFEK